MTRPLPTTLRIGHLTYTVAEDDVAVFNREPECAGFSSGALQQITVGVRSMLTGDGQQPYGADYRAEVLLHEVLHSCLRVAACDPDRDAKAGVEDVEERTVAAIAGPLLAALRDNPPLVTYLLGDGSDPDTAP